MPEYKGACHCGAVRFTLHREPDWLTVCNCSLCQKYGALWAHGSVENVTVDAEDTALSQYIWGDKTIAFNFCETCGCLSHWTSIHEDYADRMSVNFRLVPAEKRSAIRHRHFDGADSFEFLD